MRKDGRRLQNINLFIFGKRNEDIEHQNPCERFRWGESIVNEKQKKHTRHCLKKFTSLIGRKVHFWHYVVDHLNRRNHDGRKQWERKNTELQKQKLPSLCKKCSYSKLFWSAFSPISTLRIQFQCGKKGTRIPPNTDTFYAAP